MMLVLDLLPAAIGIAANPPAVIAVILLLSSARPNRNAGAFVAGWMGGLLLAGGAALLLGDIAVLLGDPTVAFLALKLAIGIGLIVLAVRKWQASRRKLGEREMPGWMASLAGFSAGRSFVVALLFAGLNPKTLAFNIAGVLFIVEAELAVPAKLLMFGVFVLLASMTVGIPLLYHLVAPRSSARVLASVSRWLVNHGTAITAVVLIVIGVLLVLDAGPALISLVG
jgi:hypothetical protein